MRAEEIANEARGLPQQERGDYLDRVCGDDLALRAEVERRLNTAESADTVATAGPEVGRTGPSDVPPAIGDLAEDHANAATRNISMAADEQAGAKIGRYKLLQLIGEGGFGSVYMAEQTEPVTRRVALKIIKLGMDTKQVIARFEAERQALAMMDHPNIAKVLDAGSTDKGRPYFVMELVRGIPITEYCDKNQLRLEQRLELFKDVCYALQHAHQKGIIHRDLKPSNILVTSHDTQSVPKVIDFGIAKATHQRLTEKTLFTEFRQFVGTPQYMSPEQAEMSGLDIDTRSDIYSLGVILYELLVGAPPFETRELLSGGYAGVSQIIRDVEPPPLSSRFTALGSEKTTVAKRRGTQPERLQNSLRGELQWIVTKSLEKDRTRRYETANQFADDIGRYLRNEPILAVPPSTAYRVRKFVRRNRAWVATATVVVLALSGGLTAATVGLLQARRELRRSRAMSEFLTELHIGFDPLAQEEADISQSVESIIDRCQALFGDDHAAIGSLLFTRASMLTAWGRNDEAEQVLRRCLEFQRNSLGPDHEALAATYKGLGNVLSRQGDTQAALICFEQAFRVSQLCFGERSVQAGESAHSLAQALAERGDPKIVPRVRELLLLAIDAFRDKWGEQSVRTLRARCMYGSWLANSTYRDQALPVLESIIEQGRPHRQELGDLWLSVLNSATVITIFAHDNDKAQVYYAELISLLRERGIAGETLVQQLLRYATWLLGIDNKGDAEEVLRQALKESRQQLPADDSQRVTATRSLAHLLFDSERREEALGILRQHLDDQRQAFGEESSQVQQARELLDELQE